MTASAVATVGVRSSGDGEEFDAILSVDAVAVGFTIAPIDRVVIVPDAGDVCAVGDTRVMRVCGRRREQQRGYRTQRCRDSNVTGPCEGLSVHAVSAFPGGPRRLGKGSVGQGPRELVSFGVPRPR